MEAGSAKLGVWGSGWGFGGFSGCSVGSRAREEARRGVCWARCHPCPECHPGGIFGRTDRQTDSAQLPGGQNCSEQLPFGLQLWVALEVSMGSQQSPPHPPTLQQLIQQGNPAKNSLSAVRERQKPWNGHSLGLSWWGTEKRVKKGHPVPGGSTPLFFTTTSQAHTPSKPSPGMHFLLGYSLFDLLSLATDSGGGKKNTDYRRQSEDINQTLLLQQSTARGWQGKPTFELL